MCVRVCVHTYTCILQCLKCQAGLVCWTMCTVVIVRSHLAMAFVLPKHKFSEGSEAIETDRHQEQISTMSPKNASNCRKLVSPPCSSLGKDARPASLLQALRLEGLRLAAVSSAGCFFLPLHLSPDDLCSWYTCRVLSL